MLKIKIVRMCVFNVKYKDCENYVYLMLKIKIVRIVCIMLKIKIVRNVCI